MPDNIVSYKATGPDQVTIQLKQAYSSIWFTYNQLAILTPMPSAWDVSAAGAKAGSGGCLTDSAADGWAKCKAVYTFMTAQNKDTATYATNPLWQVVDGPFKLTSYNVDGNYTFVPNAKYSGSPKASISELKFQTYTSDTAIYTALKTGALSLGGDPVDGPRSGRGQHGFLPASTRCQAQGYALQPAYRVRHRLRLHQLQQPDRTARCSSSCTSGRRCRCWTTRRAWPRQSAVVTPYPTTAGVPPEPNSQWVSSDMTENGGQGPYPYRPGQGQGAARSARLEGCRRRADL